MSKMRSIQPLKSEHIENGMFQNAPFANAPFANAPFTNGRLPNGDYICLWAWFIEVNLTKEVHD